MIKWKLAFYVLLVLAIVDISLDALKGHFSWFSAAYHSFAIISLVPVYGYSYAKSVGPIGFAKFVFWLNVFALIGFSLIYIPLILLAEPIGMKSTLLFVLSYLIWILLFIPMFKYAYKSKHLWAASA